MKYHASFYMLPSEKEIQAVIYMYWAMSAILLASLVFIIQNVLKNELKTTHASFLSSARRAFSTPFNISLITGCISLICFYTLSSFATIESFTENFFTSASIALGTSISLASAEASYVFYSWFRTEAIAETLFPIQTPTLRRIVYSTPFIFALQPASVVTAIFTGAKESSTTFVLTAAALSIFLTIALDTIFIATFIHVLTQLRRDLTHDLDLRFIIISKHGVLSCSIFYLAHIILAISVLYKDTLLGVFIYAISVSMYTFIVFVLISMKVFIQRAADQQSVNNTAIVDRAKKLALSGNPVDSYASSMDKLASVRQAKTPTALKLLVVSSSVIPADGRSLSAGSGSSLETSIGNSIQNV